MDLLAIFIISRRFAHLFGFYADIIEEVDDLMQLMKENKFDDKEAKTRNFLIAVSLNEMLNFYINNPNKVKLWAWSWGLIQILADIRYFTAFCEIYKMYLSLNSKFVRKGKVWHVPQSLYIHDVYFMNYNS